jgi:uncharacterized caspase-like protein/tetratricopeptide (TPR) repeat protein
MAKCVLMCAVVSLMACSPGGVSHAQRRQERDRQLVQTGPAGAGNSQKIALVIGNGTYTNAPQLKNPPNDATDMADALARLGFKVEHGVNLSQRLMKSMIREFGRKLKDGVQGLFYFAGHGVQLRGHNYLIPVDADIQSETDVEDQGVDVNFVMGLMDEAGNGLNVVILDACRNNPFARSFRSASNGLAQVDAPTGTLIAYATAPGRVARDGAGRNGAYTAELLKQMSVPGLPIEELLKRVRANLKQQTNGEQVPWESSSLVGDFYFNRPAEASSAENKSTSGPAAANPAAVEQEFWDSIKNSTDAEDFRSYLKEYPNGPHAVIARNNLRRLETAKSSNVNRDRTDSNSVASNRTNTNPPPVVPVKELIQRSYNLWRACDYDKAVNVATEVITSHPGTAEAYAIRGAAYLFELEFERAVSDLTEAVRLQPDNALAYRWRAIAYQGMILQFGNADSYGPLRDRDLQAVLRLTVNPKDAGEYEARAYAYYQMEKYELAISDLDQAIRLDPQYLPAYVFRGAAHNFSKGSTLSNEIGIKDMSEAIRLNPRFIGGYLYRGVFVGGASGINDYTEVIRLTPKAIIAYQFRAAAYDTQGKYELAIRDYNELISFGAKTYLERRADAYVKVGDYGSALRDYADYIIFNANDAAVYTKRAKVYRKLGRNTLAEADERLAKELNKKN